MRVPFLFVLLSIIVYPTTAQVYQWAKQFECSASVGTDIVIDKNRNVISAGWFKSPIDLDPGSAVYSPTPPGVFVTSSYITKLDPNGNFIWGAYYDKGSTNQLDNVRIHSLDVDANDNILVMGMYRDSLNLAFSGVAQWVRDPSWGSSDWDNIFIAKYDANGNFIWSKTWHSMNTNNGYGLSAHKMKLDDKDNILLSGRFNNLIDFNPGTNVDTLRGPLASTFFPIGNKFLLKLNANGDFLWVRQWEQTENWIFNDAWYGANELDVDTAGNIFMPINFVNVLDIDPGPSVVNITSVGADDLALVKLSSAGTLLWFKHIGDKGSDLCNSLATDTRGNVFYALRTNSDSLDTNPDAALAWNHQTNKDWAYLILKLDSAGSYLWSKKNLVYDSSTFYWGEGIATNDLGDLYLTSRVVGSTSNNQWDLDPGPATYYVSSAGSDDIALQHLDEFGTFICGGTMGGSASDWSYNICADHGRSVVMAGHFYLSANLDPSQQAPPFQSTGTSYDAFVANLKHCNYLDEPNGVEDKVIRPSVHPNPSWGTYHLSLDREYKNVHLELRNVNGQFIWQKNYDRLQETDVRINNSAGVYMLYIKQGGSTQVRKLLKW